MPQAFVLKQGQVQNLSCENFFYYHANKTHFHKKRSALGLVLRVRVFGIRKWPIEIGKAALCISTLLYNTNFSYCIFIVSYKTQRAKLFNARDRFCNARTKPEVNPVLRDMLMRGISISLSVSLCLLGEETTHLCVDWDSDTTTGYDPTFRPPVDFTSRKRPPPVSDRIGFTFWVVAYGRFYWILRCRQRHFMGETLCIRHRVGVEI